MRHVIITVAALMCCLTVPAQQPTLVHGSRFEGDLSPELLDELRQAQEAEKYVPHLVAQYRENHGRMLELANEHGLVETEAAADTLKAQFDLAARTADDLDKRIEQVWGTIFDSKSYVYNYLMDKNNRDDMLTLFEKGMNRLRQEQAQWRGTYASDAIVDYLLQKRLLTEYETALAEDTENASAADSLRRVPKVLPIPDMMEGMEPIVLQEREFIDTVSKERIYRLELSGAGELSPETRDTIRAAIASFPAGKGSAASDIARSEGGFTVAPLDGATAVRLRTALRSLEDRRFEIKIVKIAE